MPCLKRFRPELRAASCISTMQTHDPIQLPEEVRNPRAGSKMLTMNVSQCRSACCPVHNFLTNCTCLLLDNLLEGAGGPGQCAPNLC